MSNALLVGARRSTTGKPLFVAGPQVGHFYPGILLELDLEGGGFKARGAAFPGISFGVLLGRGIDYAWSATSAGSDLVDEYVETLCGGDTGYLHRGECRPMTTFDAGTIVGRPGEPDRQLVYRETVHGPVKGYATVEGQRVAITSRRSTRGRELASLRFFLDLSMNRVRSARDFVRAAAGMELTFNWLYADNRDIAQFTSGRLPVRPATVDPGLPTKGTGEYEWQGFAPAAAHAQVINPTIGRDPQLEQQAGARIRRRGRRVDVGVRAAGRPALGRDRPASEAHAGDRRRRDERRRDPGSPPDARLARPPRGARARHRDAPRVRAVAQVDAWLAAGGSRLDADLDGKVDAAGAAVLDVAWPKLANAALSPVLDAELRQELARLVPNDPALQPDGSSAYSGWWSYVHKDLRTLLARPVAGTYATHFCGGGDVARCAASLWAAIDEAAAELSAAQGADPSAWRADATKERIVFAPGILTRTMRGSNKPTFQQAVTFATHR